MENKTRSGRATTGSRWWHLPSAQIFTLQISHCRARACMRRRCPYSFFNRAIVSFLGILLCFSPQCAAVASAAWCTVRPTNATTHGPHKSGARRSLSNCRCLWHHCPAPHLTSLSSPILMLTIHDQNMMLIRAADFPSSPRMLPLHQSRQAETREFRPEPPCIEFSREP